MGRPAKRPGTASMLWRGAPGAAVGDIPEPKAASGMPGGAGADGVAVIETI